MLKLIDEGLGHLVKGIVALAPALLHPHYVPQEFKHLFKAYEETWTGVPMQDGESMLAFYGESELPLPSCNGWGRGQARERLVLTDLQ